MLSYLHKVNGDCQIIFPETYMDDPDTDFTLDEYREHLECRRIEILTFNKGTMKYTFIFSEDRHPELNDMVNDILRYEFKCDVLLSGNVIIQVTSLENK